MINIECAHVVDKNITDHSSGDNNCGDPTTDLQDSEWNTVKELPALTALSRKMGKLSFTIYS